MAVAVLRAKQLEIGAGRPVDAVVHADPIGLIDRDEVQHPTYLRPAAPIGCSSV
jgi:hypothetical protein